VTGFGTAFAVHFTSRSELHDYRDTLEDDKEMLRRFLMLALEHGVHVVPDGRFYTSAAHTEQDIQETLAALEQVFQKL
jgi:glutamate-1-semialdehyde 2,1-aminomutase